ncbi:MAG: M20/M25/M40 family metallo-hydrolase [Anaerolineaceae bacterium]|nr:M20/M25/M40 family metallo-hydrolase [Anaerolineaceae bacterium]
MRKDRLAFLEELMAAWCPSGFEERAQDVVRQRLGGKCDEVRTDVHGNVIAGVNVGAPLRVMLAGHADEIGLMVTHIDRYGFLYFQPIGGFDVSVLVGQRVLVHTAKGPVQGVVGRQPIHLMTAEQRKAVPKYEDLFIDIGARNGKDTKKRVRVSDPVTIDVEMKYLLNDLVTSRGFDDRVGSFVVAETLLAVAAKKAKVALWSVSTVQEEIGLRGARTSAFGVDPQVGIAVDVGFTSDYPGVDKKQVGDNKVGHGPIIARGPNINPIVAEGLERIAKARKIPHQFEAAPRATGTDANAIQISRAGVAAALVSVPNRYMHSPNEVVSLKDLDNAIRLLTEYVLSLKPTDRFIPGISKPTGIRRK